MGYDFHNDGTMFRLDASFVCSIDFGSMDSFMMYILFPRFVIIMELMMSLCHSNHVLEICYLCFGLTEKFLHNMGFFN